MAFTPFSILRSPSVQAILRPQVSLPSPNPELPPAPSAFFRHTFSAASLLLSTHEPSTIPSSSPSFSPEPPSPPLPTPPINLCTDLIPVSLPRDITVTIPLPPTPKLAIVPVSPVRDTTPPSSPLLTFQSIALSSKPRLSGGAPTPFSSIFEALSTTIHRDTLAAPLVEAVASPLRDSMLQFPYTMTTNHREFLNRAGIPVSQFGTKSHPHPVHKTIKRSRSLVIDEVYKMPRGYLDLSILSDPTLEFVIVLGDPLQGECHSTHPSSSNHRIASEVDHLRPYIDFYCFWSRRIPKDIASFFMVPTLNDAPGHRSFVQSPPEGYPVLACSQNQAQTLTQCGYKAVTVASSQGSTYSSLVTIHLDRNSKLLSHAHSLVALTRSRKGYFFCGDKTQLGAGGNFLFTEYFAGRAVDARKTFHRQLANLELILEPITSRRPKFSGSASHLSPMPISGPNEGELPQESQSAPSPSSDPQFSHIQAFLSNHPSAQFTQPRPFLSGAGPMDSLSALIPPLTELLSHLNHNESTPSPDPVAPDVLPGGSSAARLVRPPKLQAPARSLTSPALLKGPSIQLPFQFIYYDITGVEKGTNSLDISGKDILLTMMKPYSHARLVSLEAVVFPYSASLTYPQTFDAVWSTADAVISGSDIISTYGSQRVTFGGPISSSVQITIPADLTTLNPVLRDSVTYKDTPKLNVAFYQNPDNVALGVSKAVICGSVVIRGVLEVSSVRPSPSKA